ncbi:hypothetical protein BHF68_10430 [Desulfuribacillus alkaliarsenatis]|uniref:Uncharacterized protein n=1 Tax=Desulfuribacillus alkaliarsenatis TaxID=766136 RepID=A0A1E5G0B1_9FIRM|nr:hypothetical protein BHF68_10430 [Desulfuribacillus alkaliarsenatis]
MSGLLFFRDMSKVDIAKSATLVVIYYALIIAFEQFLISIGKYSLILVLLFIPTTTYSVIHQLFLSLFELSIWIGLILSVFAPYLYVLFGKRQYNIEGN